MDQSIANGIPAPPPPSPGAPIDWSAVAAWVEQAHAETGRWAWPPGWWEALFTTPPDEPPPPPGPGEAIDWWSVGAWVQARHDETGGWEWPPGWEPTAEPPPQVEIDLPALSPGMSAYVEYGDTPGALGGAAAGGDQQLPRGLADFLAANQLFPSGIALTAHGDADVLQDRATGGDDGVSGFAATVAAFGDARVMRDEARGGDDAIRPTATQVVAYGDAGLMADDARGGDDSLTGSPGPFPRSASVNHLHGDAYAMSGRAVGGDDLVTGGGSYPGSTNLLYGDAYRMADSARAGDDTLVGGSSARNEMWGDAATYEGDAVARGRDVFVMRPSDGANVIQDFEPGRDLIDVTAHGARSLDDLPAPEVREGDAYIFFSYFPGGPGSPFTLEQSITVVGQPELRAEWFIFAA